MRTGRNRAEYHAAEDRGRKQRANRPVWFDVPSENGDPISEMMEST
ncbi:MAG: hypothetical protein Q8K78_13615 [Planctomycetaceae bacterium]|nr:hypothetical protein [Planctomycetaceae bacterium]